VTASGPTTDYGLNLYLNNATTSVTGVAAVNAAKRGRT